MKQCIVVYGNPIEGFTFAGPFVDHPEALQYADVDNCVNNCVNTDWWIAELETPE